MRRRTVIVGASSVFLTGLAGCSEGDEGNGDNGETGGDGQSGNGDGSGGAGNGDDSDGTGNGTGESGTVRYENSFVVESAMTASGSEQTVDVTLRVNGENYYAEYNAQQTIEVYYVDGEIYQVVAGQCFKNPEEFDVPESGAGPTPGEQWDPSVSTTDDPDRTETIDGETMRVYEVGADPDSPYQGDQITVYVSDETGYLRRVETEQGTLEYHSWGEVEPIEAPDMECQEFSGGGDYDS